MANQETRTATVSRKTSETEIEVTLELDRNPGLTNQVINVETGIGFLDHVSVYVSCTSANFSTHLDVYCLG